MNVKGRIGSALCCAALFFQQSAWAGNYEIHELTRIGFDTVWLRDINNLGQMLGRSEITASGSSANFIYSGAGFVDLPKYDHASWTFEGRGLSDNGIVVGVAYDASGGTNGVIYANQSYQTLSLVDANHTELMGISPDGRYVSGRAHQRDSDGTWTSLYGFVLDRSTGQLHKRQSSNESMAMFRGINNAGVVATNVLYQGGGGMLYDFATGATDWLAAFNGYAVSPFEYSDAGFLAAYIQYFDGQIIHSRALAGRLGSLEILDLPGSGMSYGVNDAGAVVGNYWSGQADTSSAGRAFYAVLTVPEPATTALWLAGCLVVGVAARRGARPS